MAATPQSVAKRHPMTDEEEDKSAPSKQYNPIQFAFIREDWVQQKMKEKSKEFTEEKTIKVFCGTWNVNAKKPGSSDLAQWLVSGLPSADVYAIGFQEIVDLNAVNLISDHTAAKPWEALIEQTLGSKYTQMASQHLVGLALTVYVKRELMQYVHDVQDETCGVGIMGVGGNKGAVAIRFAIFDSTVCIINSHLAAHKQNVQGRNEDFHNICKRIAFQPTQQRSIRGMNIPMKPISINDHDHVFWIGDLNYRLDLSDMDLVFNRIANKDWKFLADKDQLIIEKAAGNAFVEFQEGILDFAPTYKYQPGTDVYEQREDKKKRIPAWCDRIQWRGSDISQICYRRAELNISDHKPVMAVFDVKVKILIQEKQKQVYAELVRQLDAWENECIPKVNMSRTGVHFSNVYFDTPQTERLTIENTGQVMVQFTFIPKLQEESFCKKWLQVEPPFGIIPPKEKLDLIITAHVTRETAHALNTAEEKMEDILIFRLENGRDYFVTITGEYLKSCFGASIEWLVKTPAPVRFATAETGANKVLTLPKELWRLVDVLFTRGMDEEGLFLTNGPAKQLERIREALDTGQEFPQASIHSFAETLTHFLENLAEPVFPLALCEQYQETMNLTAWCKQALMQLSAAHYNAFIYLTSFIREVLKHPKNKLSVDQAVFVFSQCLMHSERSMNPKSRQGRPKVWTILRHFLTSDEFV